MIECEKMTDQEITRKGCGEIGGSFNDILRALGSEMQRMQESMEIGRK